MSNPVTIRVAVPADLPAMVQMGCQFLETTTYSAIATPDPTRIFDLLAGMMLNENNVIFVADLDGTAVGLIAMYLVPNHVTGALMAGEVVWWVNPDARGCGSKLLKAAEAWAKEQGAEAIHMIAPTDRVGQYYQAKGYTFVESTYQKAL